MSLGHVDLTALVEYTRVAMSTTIMHISNIHGTYPPHGASNGDGVGCRRCYSGRPSWRSRNRTPIGHCSGVVKPARQGGCAEKVWCYFGWFYSGSPNWRSRNRTPSGHCSGGAEPVPNLSAVEQDWRPGQAQPTLLPIWRCKSPNYSNRLHLHF